MSGKLIDERKFAFFSMLLLGLALIFLLGFYLLYMRNRVLMLPQGLAPTFFSEWVDFFYPRYKTERHRFRPEFFLAKADQVMIRLSLVVFLLIVFMALYFFNPKSKSRIKAFWNRQIPGTRIEILRIFFALISLFIVWDWIRTLYVLSSWKAFYEPVFLLKVLGWNFPPFWLAALLYGLLVLALICLLFKIWPLFSSILVVFGFIIIQAYFFSFHKIDHTYATYNPAVFGMPFLLYEAYMSRKSKANTLAAWPLLLIQLGVATAYFLAGLEKLLVGKLAWFAPQNLLAYLFEHQSFLYEFLANYPWMATVLSILVVFFELAFIGILFLPKYTFFFLACGVLFHWSTYFFLGVGGLLSPWILVYVFYIPWENYLKIK